MARKITYKLIAGKAGVSLMSVSNALRHPDRVRVTTREKVEEAIRALGGEVPVPDRPAGRQVVAHRPHRRLRFVMANIPQPVRESPVYSRVFQSVIEEAGKQGFDISFSNMEKVDMIASESLQENIDAMILMGQWAECPTRPRIPTVTLMSTQVPFGSDHVGYNRQSVGRIIAEHFHRSGISSAAYVGPNDHERFVFFRDVFRRLNGKAKIASYFVGAPYRIIHGEQVIDRTAVRKVAGKLAADPPEAIFCHADDLATAVRHALYERASRHLEILWAGCNNDPSWTLNLGPGAVTVDIGASEIGRIAVRRSTEIARNPGQPKQTLLIEPYLVEIGK